MSSLLAIECRVLLPVPLEYIEPSAIAILKQNCPPLPFSILVAMPPRCTLANTTSAIRAPVHIAVVIFATPAASFQFLASRKTIHTKVFAPVFDHSVISLAFRTISWDHGIKIVIFCCDEFIYFLNQAALIKLTAAVPARE
jgi:hypothetical protein